MPVEPDPSPALSDYAHPEKLVTADWLAAHLDDPNVVIVESD
ncbi:MAG TPA: sulfurtransferase, partial [Acidimicrobiia bacterium]|nr:sulfurtransferase [Acidimicrobiia bacterium]